MKQIIFGRGLVLRISSSATQEHWFVLQMLYTIYLDLPIYAIFLV